ncbi:hypothetical protein Q9251_04330 [Alkalihalobacillus macyae]|uniref:hypothetical protein n=1 Tax=Guptibacillus hwajinpoensis TaxID=208199 RepID=UPI00273B36BF|nr:hypothetical protein [Alkalihalobacillus macyae]MDP4550108.1 hypothetical protein [Alkalihalobacillus macyae]
MVSVDKLISVGIIGLSIMGGLATFYIISDLSKQKRREHIEGMVSQLIYFTIYLWIGKIIINFSIFIKDPLAILAYPSSSHAFYFAILMSLFVSVIKSIYTHKEERNFIESLLFVLLVTSFVYEFIQLVWNNNSFAIGSLVVSCILLILFISSRGRITESTLMFVIATLWSIGMFVVAYIQPITTVFGYIMMPWFVGVFYVSSLSIIMIKKRRRESRGWN